jgi:hypothetical protein
MSIKIAARIKAPLTVAAKIPSEKGKSKGLASKYGRKNKNTSKNPNALPKNPKKKA